MKTTAGLSVMEKDGGLSVTDGTGSEVFASPQPLMWDSSGSAAQARGVGAQIDVDRTVAPAQGDFVAVMPVSVAEGKVRVTPNQGMLADPQVSWPVYIDPTWDAGEGVSKYEWQLIAEAWPTERSTGAYYKFDKDSGEGVGLCSTSSDSSCVKTGRKRLIWEFTFPAGIRGASVSSAEFSAYKTSQWSCADTSAVRLYRVNSITSSTNWSTHHSHWDNGTTQDQLILQSKAPTVCTGREYWNATAGAQMAAANSWTSLTLGLRAANEGSMTGNWRKFRNDATLSVTFNRYPNTPGNPMLDMSQATGTGPSGYLTRDNTPQLSASVSDPDGGTVRGLFQVYNGSTKSWEGETGLAASGSTVSISTGPLAENILYTVRVYAKDSAGLVSKSWSNYIQFKVDTTPPDVPAAEAQDIGTGIDAKYVENDWAGGLGKVGRFTFRSNGATDIARYRYSFDSTTYTNEVNADPATDESVTPISYSPSAPGLHTLRVWAVDEAGWVSSPKVYNFYVYAAAKASWWKLDGNGTNSVAGNAALTPEGAYSWVAGPLQSPDYPADQAFHAADATALATTSGPVLHTTGSYTVTALVNPSSAATWSIVAASQDGVNASGFRLGILDWGCQVGTRCWGIWWAANDSATSPGWTTLTPATPGFEIAGDTWTALAAVYDATAHEFRLYVNGELAGVKPYTVKWDAVGKFRIGDSMVGGASDLSWLGDIDDVRVYETALDVNTIRRIASGSQDPGDVPHELP